MLDACSMWYAPCHTIKFIPSTHERGGWRGGGKQYAKWAWQFCRSSCSSHECPVVQNWSCLTVLLHNHFCLEVVWAKPVCSAMR